MRLANFSDAGSMCGSPDEVSTISSRSMKTAPGICAASNSVRALRPCSGRNSVASTMRRSFFPSSEASHSVLTNGFINHSLFARFWPAIVMLSP